MRRGFDRLSPASRRARVGVLVVGMSAAAIAGATALEPWAGPAYFGLALVAVAVAVWIGGLGAALAAVVLSGAGTALVSVWGDARAHELLVSLALFLGAALVVVGLGHYMRTARLHAERSEERLALVVRVQQALEPVLDLRERLHALAATVVPELADACVVWLDGAEDGAPPALAAVAVARGGSGELVVHTTKAPPGGWLAGPALLRRLDAEEAERIAQRLPDDVRLHLGAPGSALVAPLMARGVALGAMMFVGAASRGRYGAADLELAADVAQRAALQLDNARLFEAERAAAAALERSDALKTAMVRAVSHELRTPITAITTAADGLELVDDPKDRAELRRIVVAEARRLERVVENLLDLSRLEGGILRPRLDDCAVADLIAGSRSAAAPFLATVQVAAEPEDGWPIVRTDPVLSERILVNLLQNAAVHGAPPVRIDVRRTSHRVEIVVSDEGAGVAPERADEIFVGFVGGARGGGLGLGLALSRRLAEAQGGELRLLPSKEGARFALALPLARLPHAPKAPASDAVPAIVHAGRDAG